MIYLASPYSHPNPAVREERYQKALLAVSHYAKRRLAVYSPIVHWHEVAKKFDLPGDALFWEAQNKAMLKRACSMTVLQIDGWFDSIGVRQELIWADELGLPVTNIYDHELLISTQ